MTGSGVTMQGTRVAERPVSLLRPDGLKLGGIAWEPAMPERFRVFLGHSHVVHSGMLGPLGQAFHRAGCGVMAFDIRGHGKSTDVSNPAAHLAGVRGWHDAVDDVVATLDFTFAGVPFEQRIVVVPNIHALMTLAALQRHPDMAGQVVLVSPPPNQLAIARLGASFAAARASFRQAHLPDETMLRLIYAFLGNHLPDRQHMLDVVTADRAVIQQILDDRHSWRTPSTAYWQAIFHGQIAAWDWPEPCKVDPATRFMIMYGGQDPMTRDGAYCSNMVEHLTRHGAREVALHRVEGARSGLFLEERRFGIAGRILRWAGEGNRDFAAGSLPPARSALDFARSKLQQRKGTAPVNDADLGASLISLCYDGIYDEGCWNDILSVVMITLSEGEQDPSPSFITTMMPHLDRAFELHQLHRRNAALGEVWGAVLERIAIGCALVNERGEIVHENARYRAALASRLDPLEVASGPGLEQSTTLMTQCLLGVNPVGWTELVTKGGMVLQWHGEPVGFLYRPQALERNAPFLGNALALVLLRDAAGDLREKGGLKGFWGLTGQEAEVAVAVMEGRNPKEIAIAMQLSINTIRTHLAQIYAKTGTTGRSELVRKLLGSPLAMIGNGMGD